MNKLLTKVLAISIASTLILSLGSCAKPSASSKTQPEISSSQTENSAPPVVAEFPITITDHAGREVTFDKPAEKIVSGYYITSSLTIALGLKDKVVGIEAKAGSRPIYKLSAPAMLDLPNTGTAKDFNLEGCIALKPDLVIVPIKLKESAEALTQVGIKTLCVNPEDNALLIETINMIAKATGTTEKADELIKYIADKKSELTSKISVATNKPKVYMAGNSDLLSTAGEKMYQSTLIKDAGGANVAADIDSPQWATISIEQLIAYNPEYIIIPPQAEYTKESVLTNTAIAGIDAVKNSNVYEMPKTFEAWDSPVPSSFLGTLWLASIIHSDLYTFDAFVSQTEAFYTTFYGFTPDKGAITK